MPNGFGAALLVPPPPPGGPPKGFVGLPLGWYVPNGFCALPGPGNDPPEVGGGGAFPKGFGGAPVLASCPPNGLGWFANGELPNVLCCLPCPRNGSVESGVIGRPNGFGGLLPTRDCPSNGTAGLPDDAGPPKGFGALLFVPFAGPLIWLGGLNGEDPPKGLGGLELPGELALVGGF